MSVVVGAEVPLSEERSASTPATTSSVAIPPTTTQVHRVRLISDDRPLFRFQVCFRPATARTQAARTSLRGERWPLLSAEGTPKRLSNALDDFSDLDAVDRDGVATWRIRLQHLGGFVCRLFRLECEH